RTLRNSWLPSRSSTLESVTIVRYRSAPDNPAVAFGHSLSVERGRGCAGSQDRVVIGDLRLNIEVSTRCHGAFDPAVLTDRWPGAGIDLSSASRRSFQRIGTAIASGDAPAVRCLHFERCARHDEEALTP
ncbi:MAG TPA: hypothetical protein VN858_12210, partial [Casimicrobiaceae bacterium]|nr:hypothetical protein [Casimicrobiaceae bacterium]